MTLLLVCLGAALGAPARYLADRAVQSRHDSVFPWGTLGVNVTGSLILGVVVGAATRHDVPSGLVAGVGTGFCGALTTYSTFGYETVRLRREGAGLLALSNVAAGLAVGVVAAFTGYAAGSAL